MSHRRFREPSRSGTKSVFFQTMIELARGCPSTGWCVTLGASHVFNLSGLFDVETQATAFGKTGHVIAPSRGVPTGTAVPTADGWLVNGRWDYCSGSPYSTHALNGVIIPQGDDAPPKMGLALLPRSSYEIVEDWGDVLGLKGSGSHTIVAENAELPTGYVLDVDLTDIDTSQLVGYGIHGNPMYAGPNSPFFLGEVVACAIGIARAAPDEYRALARAKTTMWPPFGSRADDQSFQSWYGQALTLTDSAEALLVRVGEIYHEYCEESVSGGEPFTRAREVRLGNMVGQAGVLAVQAMDGLIRSSGASSLKDGTRMQRYWRDMSTYRSHISNSLRDFLYVGSGAAHLSDGGGNDGFALRS